jgi:hypothetical protein
VPCGDFTEGCERMQKVDFLRWIDQHTARFTMTAVADRGRPD